MLHPAKETIEALGSVHPMASAAKSVTPLRYWEVDQFFRCPLAGMCLTLIEQQQAAKKAGFSSKKNTPFEIHEALVASSECENRISRRVDALLQRKYAKTSVHLHDLDDAAFLKRFKQAFASGNYLGTVWAAATHPTLSASTRREVFGEIHMSMHWSAEQRSLVMQRLERKEMQLDAALREARELRRLNKAVLSEKALLQRDRDRLAADLVAAQTVHAAKTNAVDDPRCVAADSLKDKDRAWKQRLDALAVTIERQQQDLNALTQQNQVLREALAKQKALNDHCRIEARKVMAELTGMGRCDPACPAFDLCRKRILIVGGITRMASLYRELIEGGGGVFEYHDGYMKNGVRQLESRLKRADVVLCPVSCNSHAACSIVKNLAKKHNKTVHMLANSSLSAVSQVIWGGHSQKGTIN